MENVEFCEADQNTRTCITRYQVAAGQMLGVQGTASIVNKEEIYGVLKSYYTKTRTNNTNKSRPTLMQMEMIKIGSTGCGGGTY